MTRLALIALAVLIVLGLVVSVLPAPVSEAKADVTLEDVALELYPAADANAKWLFKAQNVTYNPETRESIVTGLEDGRRLVADQLDLTIKAPNLTIDSQDNLRTQQAEIYVVKGCWLVKLGQPTGNSVLIDQNSGYQAPYADIRGPNLRSKGGPLDASFDLESKFNLSNPEDEFVQGGRERCVAGKLIQEKL